MIINYNTNFRKAAKLLFLAIPLGFSLIYFLLVFDSKNYLNPYNFLINIFSVFMILYSFQSIKKVGVKSYNIFGFFYFLSIYINSLNLSRHQFERNMFDLVLFIIAPFIFFLTTYIIEKVKIRKISLPSFKISLDLVYIFLIIFYVIISLYIISKKGLRISYFIGVAGAVKSGDSYSIPGLSGIQGVLKWSLIILSPYTNKKNAFIGFSFVLIVGVLISVKRGDLMRIMVYYFILFISVNHHRLYSKKVIISLIATITLILVIFTQFGEIRNNYATNATRSDIHERLDSRIDLLIFEWVYAYVAINHDVALLHMESQHSYRFDSVNTSLFKHFINKEDIYIFNERISGYSFRGYNASTIMGPFINDFGNFFILELFYYSLMVGLFILLIRTFYYEPVYIFMLTMISFSFFGNYVLTSNVMASMVFCIFLSTFILNPKDLCLGNKKKKLKKVL